MKRIYLTGHHTFSNRGCEAIVRSTVQLLKEHYGDIEVIVPSSNIVADSKQWPDASESGVSFVQAFLPRYARYWVHLQGLPFSFLKQWTWPFPIPARLRSLLREVSGVLSVGGDNYSLDYRLPLLLMGLDGAAMHEGTPVVLWGASVGPFDADPHFIPVVRRHLSRMSMIVTRETETESYLRGMGLDNVVLAPDPAFTLIPEAVDCGRFWPSEDGAGTLGINMSYLVTRYRPEPNAAEYLINEVCRFINYVVKDVGLSVLLVPHVTPFGRSRKNDVDNDDYFLKRVLRRIGDMDGRVRQMDSTLNAAQIKHVIGNCRFFIGARTHSTIAALSSRVPTVSIAYSVKARGLNKDLFGHTNYVLETPVVSAETLTQALDLLIENEASIRATLQERIPEWQARVRKALIVLDESMS